MVQRVALAGASGSIGRQTLEVLDASPGEYELVALSVQRSVDAVLDAARRFGPHVVAVADDEARREVADRLHGVEVVADLAEVVGLADVVVNAVVGFAGLRVTVETLRAGRRLALANKESLIAGAPVVQPLRATPGAEIVPVDSEHCALHQCLRSSFEPRREVARLVLTASGGPFRGRTADDLAGVTVAEALAHPTWSMGPKITVDSSTLMNKGLEVIEAHELFGVDYDRIDVVVHPQSVVHSMVEFTDGSTIAQLSMPDMRLPIAYALGYPQRSGVPFGRIDWTSLARLDFAPPDRSTFRCLDVAIAAGRAGGGAPAWVSAANEVAVAAFLDGALSWQGIAELGADALECVPAGTLNDVDDVIELDAQARRWATRRLARRGAGAAS